MAVKDGLPATDFSRMNRKYIKAVAEGGSGGGGGDNIMVINRTDTESAFTLDKTFEEIAAAVTANKFCYIKSAYIDEESGYTEYTTFPVNIVERNPDHGEHEPEYWVEAGNISFTCDSPDEYPAFNF